MRNHFREIVGFLVIALALFGFVKAFAADTTVDPGKKIFEGKCAQCHGKDAKGVAKMAKVLKVDPVNIDLTRPEAVTMTSDDLEAIVTNGKNKMGKYKGKLTADQIKEVVAYLKTLQDASQSK